MMLIRHKYGPGALVLAVSSSSQLFSGCFNCHFPIVSVCFPLFSVISVSLCNRRDKETFIIFPVLASEVVHTGRGVHEPDARFSGNLE